MLDRGTNINELDDEGRTALFVSIENGLIEIVKLLLDKGININIKDNYGYDASQIAFIEGYGSIVSLLLPKKTNKKNMKCCILCNKAANKKYQCPCCNTSYCSNKCQVIDWDDNEHSNFCLFLK
jgi:ankyrin repeat protein